MKVFESDGFKTVIGLIAGIAVFIIAFVTSAEIAFYSDYGFYEKEFEKYNVNNEASIINMETEELVRVTKESMLYLRGDRENLDIQAEIDGTMKEYYNEIDKSHMADVQELFLEGLEKRNLSVAIMVVSVLLLLLTNGGRQTVLAICNGIRNFFFFMAGIIAVVAAFAVFHFTEAFYMMHYLLFDNDNWLLDANISRLINMFPEEFFVDMGLRWLMIFIFIIFFILVLCFLAKRGMIKKNAKKAIKLSGGTYEQG